MSKQNTGAPPPRRRRRVRLPAVLAACLVVAAIAGFLIFSGGDERSFAGVAPNGPSCTSQESRSSGCPRNTHFDPQDYLHGGIRANTCHAFATQADAQAVLKANPSDPNRIDQDRNGIACPGLPAPRDLDPDAAAVRLLKCRRTDQRSARCPKPSQPFSAELNLRHQVDEYDCDDYASQADAQAVLRFQPSDPNKLDDDDDGIACPDAPAPKDRKPIDQPLDR